MKRTQRVGGFNKISLHASERLIRRFFGFFLPDWESTGRYQSNNELGKDIYRRVRRTEYSNTRFARLITMQELVAHHSLFVAHLITMKNHHHSGGLRCIWPGNRRRRRRWSINVMKSKVNLKRVTILVLWFLVHVNCHRRIR
jgi:hypothetical protein